MKIIWVNMSRNVWYESLFILDNRQEESEPERPVWDQRKGGEFKTECAQGEQDYAVTFPKSFHMSVLKDSSPTGALWIQLWAKASETNLNLI